MSSYFKYTNGEAFTINGSDYTGFFTVSSKQAFTGKIVSSTSVPLTPKPNFISEIYLNEFEFDTNIGSLSTPTIYTPNYFDVFNKKGLDAALGVVNTNNLLIFKSLIIPNPNLFDFAKNKSFFYGLSSTDVDARNDDITTGKNVYTHIDPFAFDSEWNFLDRIENGVFFVDSTEAFKYVCFDDQKIQYTLSGSFVNPQLQLGLLANDVNLDVDNILYDDIEDTLFFISDEFINIYNASDYIICGTLNLIDRIVLDLGVNSELIRIGLNIRLELSGSNLLLKNKYSNDLYQTFETSSIGEVLTLDIRNTDDFVAILSKLNGNLLLSFFDSQNIEETLKTTILNDISVESDKYKLLFSGLDSNLIFVSSGSDLQTRLISNPTQVVGRFNSNNLLYLRDYIWNTTFERFNKIQIKFNSNYLPSNSFNNLTYDIKTYNDISYLILHNVGRIYVMKQPPTDLYLSPIPLDLEKNFFGISCSESSFGLYFNNTISNIIKDILNIYANCSKKIKVSTEGNISFEELSSLDLKINNFYMNGNETINVVTLQRIFLLISDLQRQLISDN